MRLSAPLPFPWTQYVVLSSYLHYPWLSVFNKMPGHQALVLYCVVVMWVKLPRGAQPWPRLPLRAIWSLTETFHFLLASLIWWEGAPFPGRPLVNNTSVCLGPRCLLGLDDHPVAVLFSGCDLLFHVVVLLWHEDRLESCSWTIKSLLDGCSSSGFLEPGVILDQTVPGSFVPGPTPLSQFQLAKDMYSTRSLTLCYPWGNVYRKASSSDLIVRVMDTYLYGFPFDANSCPFV